MTTKVTAGCRTLQNEELHDSYSLLNIQVAINANNAILDLEWIVQQYQVAFNENQNSVNGRLARAKLRLL